MIQVHETWKKQVKLELTILQIEHIPQNCIKTHKSLICLRTRGFILNLYSVLADYHRVN